MVSQCQTKKMLWAVHEYAQYAQTVGQTDRQTDGQSYFYLPPNFVQVCIIIYSFAGRMGSFAFNHDKLTFIGMTARAWLVNDENILSKQFHAYIIYYSIKGETLATKPLVNNSPKPYYSLSI